MKFIIACVMLISSLSSFAALSDLGGVAVISSAPTMFVVGAKSCISGQDDGWGCLLSSTAAPFSTTTIAALVALKEEVIQVEQDAHNALAGEGISLALSELIEKVRSENAELRDSSDEKIISIMLEVVELN